MVNIEQAWARARREAFRENYSDMRSWGWTHEQIAMHLGIRRVSLMRKCVRHDIYIPEPYERAAFDRLEQLIEAGRPFTSDDLPPLGSTARVTALLHAKRRGRIRAVGRRPNPRGGNELNIWQAVTSDMAVAQ